MLGLISAAFGRGFMFFMPQYNYLRFIRKDNPWWSAFTWTEFTVSKSNAYLVAIFGVCLVEGAILAITRRIREQQAAIAAYLGYVVSYLLGFVLQFTGQTVLTPDYMNYALVVGTFVPLGYLIDRHLPSLSDRKLVALAILFSAACAAAMFGSPWIYRSLNLNGMWPWQLVALVVATMYALMLVGRALHSATVVLLGLAIVNVGVIPSVAGHQRDSCHALRDLNVFMSDASLLATKITGRPGLVLAFGDPSEFLVGDCYKTIRVAHLAASFAQLGHAFLGKPLSAPSLDDLTREDFAAVVQNNAVVALLAVSDVTRRRFEERAASIGVAPLELVGLLPDPASGAKLYLLKLQRQ